MWFKSIEISKELQYQYEYETFEYEKVADILVLKSIQIIPNN